MQILNTEDVEGSTDKLVHFDLTTEEYKDILSVAKQLKKLKILKKADIKRYGHGLDLRSKKALIAATIGVSLKFMLQQEEDKKNFEQHSEDFQGTT